MVRVKCYINVIGMVYKYDFGMLEKNFLLILLM